MLAFIGCNAKSPNFAQASETSSGAYHRDMDYMVEAVSQLKEQGYLPIVTFQHEERYFWSPNASMVRDFTAVAGAGAVIVSGSQSHVPHYTEFYNDTFLHYGLGNLLTNTALLKIRTSVFGPACFLRKPLSGRRVNPNSIYR